MKGQEPITTDHKSGRNDPCPCGSGKKYKKCCMFKDYVAPGMQDTIRSRLVQDLFAFTAKYYYHVIPEAYDFFWDSQPSDKTLPPEFIEFTEINFHEWLLFDYIVDPVGYKTIVDLYMEQKKNLSAAERDMLKRFQQSVLSLYEVQEIIPEQGLILKDLLLGGEYDVKEKMATRGLFRWDIFAARLMLIDEHYIINGSVYPYPVQDRQYIIDAMKAECDDFREENPDASLRECLKVVGAAFNDIWYDFARSDRRPGIRTKTGEPLMFCKIIYTFADRTQVLEKLRSSGELEWDSKNEFTWLEQPGIEGSSVLASLRVTGKQLILECMSKKRLQMSKDFMARILGDLVSHKKDVVKDPYEVLESESVRQKTRKTKQLPRDIEQQFYEKFMREHMTNWLDEKIPALDNRTPRECVKINEGKEKVIDLLKSFENIEEKKKRNGELYCDFTWVWQALGLERQE
jgi:hypothetical protein